MSASAPTQRIRTRSPAVQESSSPALKLREKAYQSFTERLLAQDIRPGQFITQRELVGITGMSLGAVRELIPRLEADGLIKTVPQRGMQIAHVDLNLIRNAFQFRLILEREAAANFAEAATDDELEALREFSRGDAGRGEARRDTRASAARSADGLGSPRSDDRPAWQ